MFNSFNFINTTDKKIKTTFLFIVVYKTFTFGIVKKS